MTSVGVVVGRFQVPDLHDGHTELLRRIAEENEYLVVILGVAAAINSKTDPLSFGARRLMIEASCPGALVLPLSDDPSDQVWSDNLDILLRAAVNPRHQIVLYGSRDSFIPHYRGRFKTEEVPTVAHNTGTAVRAEVGQWDLTSSDFRSGVIWASQNRFPTCFTTVDVAIFNVDYQKILLGRKPGQELFQLIGGFADPVSPSFEADAVREAKEETGLDVCIDNYVTSSFVDDSRYKKGPDHIKTLLFVARCSSKHQSAKAHDDIEEVRWFPLDTLDLAQIRPLHRDLVRSAIESLEERELVNAG